MFLFYLTCKCINYYNLFHNVHDREFKKYLLKFLFCSLYFPISIFATLMFAIFEILLKQYHYDSNYVYLLFPSPWFND